jgi:hypothetical protein
MQHEKRYIKRAEDTYEVRGLISVKVEMDARSQ